MPTVLAAAALPAVTAASNFLCSVLRRVLTVRLRAAKRRALRAALIADLVLAMAEMRSEPVKDSNARRRVKRVFRPALIQSDNKNLVLGPVSRILSRALRRGGRHFSQVLADLSSVA
jgi:hypothetical protein